MEHPGAGPTMIRRLFVLRWVAICAQTLAVLAATWIFFSPLPLGPMFAVIGLATCANLRTGWRLRSGLTTGNGELFSELLVDVTTLTALLYLSGGSTNPFVSVYLLPLTIAATSLPMRHAWAMAAVTSACYTFLMFYRLPLGEDHAMHGAAFSLHVTGMWVNFIVSAVLITGFVSTVSESLRRRERELAAARERAMRDEQVLALGTFAAGAAHELGTPLSTIAVLAREMELEHTGVPALTADLGLLRTQVDQCRKILNGLTVAAGQARAQPMARQGLDSFLADVIDKWRLLRPEVPLTLQCSGPGTAPQIAAEETLSQTLINLLNNAADASPDSVEVEGVWSEGEWTVEVRDHGPGITEEVAARAGRTFISTKSDGRGIGLFLANATIERLGGSVALFNRNGGGGCTRVTIPLARLVAGT
ncbi:MAG: ATP-binding protein [Burkholderiales bacterium]